MRSVVSIVANRMNAQSSCAGHFIESHFHEEWKGVWTHVDMGMSAAYALRALLTASISKLDLLSLKVCFIVYSRIIITNDSVRESNWLWTSFDRSGCQ